MQVFIPYSEFPKIFDSLDYRRLGKQRVETLQLLNAINSRKNNDYGKGWVNHPATKMWANHAHFLAFYGVSCCLAWRKRGYADSLLPHFLNTLEQCPMIIPPEWWGRPDIHNSHRSMLLQKDPEHYANYKAHTTMVDNYVWCL